MAAMPTYRALDPDKVIDTIRRAAQRISERFPGAGLGGVCAELLTLARENSAGREGISGRNMPLRVGILVLLAAGAAGLAWIVSLFYVFPRSAENVYTVLQGIEAAANLVVLMGAAVLFLIPIEERLKRRAALKALHELRSIVHVIDMHQLTKDPSAVVSVGGKTASSPARTLTRYRAVALSRLLLGDAVADRPRWRCCSRRASPIRSSPRPSATSSASPPACRRRSGRRS